MPAIRRHISPRAKSALLIFAAAALFAPAAQAARYEIDPAHSFVLFRTQHLGFSWLSGRFDAIEGWFEYDPQGGADAQKIEVTVDTASVNTNHAERDKHLRSDDFLDVESFPRATFVSRAIEPAADGGALVRGDLTLHGETRAVEIPVKRIGEGDDPWGGYRAGFEGSLVIRRADFDMGYKLGPKAEEVELMLFVEGVRQ